VIQVRSIRSFSSLPPERPKVSPPSAAAGLSKITSGRSIVWLAVMAAAILLGMLLMDGRAVAGVSASISGTVKDESGLAIVGAKVTATNVETGITQMQLTNTQGFYSFLSLPLGHYKIEVQQAGFRAYERTGLVLDVDSALAVDVVLQVGEVKETVQVSGEAAHVETSSTQMGEVIATQQMTEVPLVSRSYTDLLALQAGVTASSSGMTGGGAGGAGGNFIAAVWALPMVSGSLNAGNLSVNGMREANNGFLLNGATVQEFGFGGTSVVPNLDSIAEFRILTNNFDAEYGNYSGGQINVITKSGSNDFHGNLFEFLRNTNLDAAYFFDAGQRGTYHQNQFGGTFGGPIKREKVFFFADYQRNRVIQGLSSGNLPVPSQDERNGDFSAFSTQMTGVVNGSAWAQQLSNELGSTVTAGEHYYTTGCTTTAQCVFPNAQIPTSAIATPAKQLLGYIAPPNGTSASGQATLSTSAFKQNLTDDKGSGRIDANTRIGTLSGYYFIDNYTLDSPYSAGTQLPGFATLGVGRDQVFNLGDTKVFGNSTVNEARVEYVRMKDSFNNAQGGAGVTVNSLGFVTGANTLGIALGAPNFQGIPPIQFNAFSIGVPQTTVQGLIENTFQALDNFGKVVGTHTLKLGGSIHFTQQNESIRNVANGSFQFFGTETGIDFADFLLGAPTFYVQGEAPPAYGRNHYAGLYGQDSWRVRSNLTINYGLRWEFSTPWSEEHNQIETLVPGLQSKVFPGSPTGWVFPGDPGIPSTLAPTRYDKIAPRVGIAYSPNFSNGVLRKLTGAPGQTSIRAGWGLFYTSFEGATNFNEIGDAPFGYYYVSPAPPQFTTPFVDRGTGNIEGQRFPVAIPPNNVSASNPDSLVNWSQFLPISSSPGFFNKNQVPYAEDYELSIQRQFSKAALLTMSYVGTQAHKLLSTIEANPGNPALCLSLSQASEVAPGTQPCGPGLENNVFTTATGQVVNGTRAPFGNNFGSDGYFMTIGQSSYNSLQVNLRTTSGPLQVVVAYTYSKCMDNASGYGEQVNPINPKLSMGLCAFDVPQNLVVNYTYNLPFNHSGGPKRLTHGWQFSGITRFSGGEPVILYEMDDNSLLGTAYAGPMPIAIDVPNYSGGGIHINDPRSGQPYFDVSEFSQETLGHLGTARRRFFHGPGINNWDAALLKDTQLTERMTLQFRAEFYNIFNHAQFGGIQGNWNASNFGYATSTQPPRIGQLSLKLLF